MQKNDIQTIRVNTQKPYEVMIGKDILHYVDNIIKNKKRVIITDSNLYNLYKNNLSNIVDKDDIFYFKAGEESKNRETLYAIYDFLINKKADRYTYIIAVGGGVAGDIAAFAASTYMRGMPLIHVPTSLLAMVDSSIGGKTAINYGGLKNIIGSFYQPELVISDVRFLDTLPTREYLSALSEIIKYGVIRDEKLFVFIEQNKEKIKEKNMETLIKIVTQSTENKVKIVENDEKEKGERALLNFGHTLAHAIESITKYKEYLHGEAVSIGEIFATHLSIKKGLTNHSTLNRIKSLLDYFKLPTKINKEFNSKELYRIMKQDKKNKNGVLRFVLTKGIGLSILSHELSESDIMDSIHELKE